MPLAYPLGITPPCPSQFWHPERSEVDSFISDQIPTYPTHPWFSKSFMVFERWTPLTEADGCAAPTHNWQGLMGRTATTSARTASQGPETKGRHFKSGAKRRQAGKFSGAGGGKTDSGAGGSGWAKWLVGKAAEAATGRPKRVGTGSDTKQQSSNMSVVGGDGAGTGAPQRALKILKMKRARQKLVAGLRQIDAMLAQEPLLLRQQVGV